MSNYSSEEELGDSLQIKPPQARPKVTMDRIHRRDQHANFSNRPTNFYRRDYDDSVGERGRRRDFDYNLHPQRRPGNEMRTSTRHHYQYESGADRSGHRKRLVRERLEPPLEKHYQQQYSEDRREPSQPSSSLKSEPESPPREQHSRQLQKQKKKVKRIEEEEERVFREIERRRERERRKVELRRHPGEGDGSGSSGTHKRTKRSRDEQVDPSSQSFQQRSTNQNQSDDQEMLDLTVSDEDVQSLLPRIEVEDADQSHSEEDGALPHSDLSDSEKEDEHKVPKQGNRGLNNATSDISSESEGQSQSESASSSDDSNSEDSESDSSDSDASPKIVQKNSKKKHVTNGKAKHKKLKQKQTSTHPGSESEKEEVHSIPSDDGDEIIPLQKDTVITSVEVEIVVTIEKKSEREMTEVEKACHELETLEPYYPAIQGCRRVEEFALLNRIEEGTYGVVYRAKDKRTNEIVALKRLKMEKEKDGFPITSLREINTLLKSQHENVVTVREIVVGSNTDKIFLVMDYVEHDLKSLMETLKQKKQEFMMGEVKCLLIQLLRAVAHLHDNWILHRDLKTSNLLLSHKGVLKVGDFGLAREYGSPLKSYTPIVVTLWYRAPELLLGTKEYSTPIDMWSVGCIFGELLKMEPMFPGKSEANQLNLIFQTLGTPNDKIWSGYSKLPLLQKMTFGDYPVNKLKTKFGILSDVGIDIMNKFLTYNPAKRVTADESLKHSFFQEAPLPIDPSIFPTWPAKSEMGARKHASPKPPSGGRQYKDLKEDDSVGFFLGVGDRRPPMGAGFSLKF